MFLAFDESTEYPEKVFGTLVLPRQEVSELDKEWTELRLKHKLFAEIKWESIDQYYERYFDFIDLFFSHKNFVFHSISFQSQNKYNAAYILIRSIGWQMQNERMANPLFILFDEYGSVGEKETLIIKNFLKKDKDFKLDIDFCNQGTSHVIGALQLVDIITGAMATKINKITNLMKGKMEMIKHIEQKNGLPLDWPIIKLPRLYEYKIRHFKPISQTSSLRINTH